MSTNTINLSDRRRLSTEAEQLQTRMRALHSGTLYGLAVNAAVVALSFGSLWDDVNILRLGAWFVLMALAIAARFVLHRAYSRVPLLIGARLHWRTAVVLSATAIGLGWGWFVLDFFPVLQAAYQHAILLLILVLVTAHVIAPFRATAGLFLVLAATPLLAGLFSRGDSFGSIAGALVLILLGVQWVTLEILLVEITKNASLQRLQEWSEVERGEYVRSVETANRLLAQEVTERELAEANLKIAKQAAEDASRAKGEFLAYTSHEIRTPLNAIIGFTRALLDTPLDSKQRDYLRRVRNAGVRLLALINGLLDMSKIEAGKLEIEQNDFRLRELLEEVLHEQGVVAEEKGIRLDADIAANLPDLLVGDSLRVGQVLRNLVSNAIKFTDRGKVTIALKLAAVEGETARILFKVTDTGRGMSAETQAALFQAYRQGESGASRALGTGLGLAISKSLCGLMSGAIGVRSEPGKGSEFHFELPFKVSSQTAVTSPSARKAAAHRQRELNVLVAEDNEDNQLLIELLLRKWGARFTIVGNGELAIAEAGKNDFDLVLMDLEMPVLDGFGAVAEIRKKEANGRRVPIVALSAHGIVGYRERCMAAGMDDYLTKPIDADALNSLLDSYADATTAAPPVAQESRT